MKNVLEAGVEHVEELAKLANKLYTGSELEELQSEIVEMLHSKKHKFLMYFSEDNLDKPIAFMHLSIREDYVEGTVGSPTGYLEGVLVDPNFRRKGIPTKLLQVGKVWLKDNGCTQIGSDIEINNQDSYHFHISLGFKEANRLIAFIRDLE